MKNILNKFILALVILPSAAFAICNPFVGGTQLSASALNNALASPCITAGSITGVPISNATINSSSIGLATPAAGSFTTLNASGAVSGVGVTALLASPPAIGSTAPSSGAFTTLSASTATMSGISSGTGITQTISANATAATTGYGLVFNNTQSSAVAGVSVDMGSSAQAHDAFVAKGSNASAADAFMANMQTGFNGNLFHGSVNSVDQYRLDASGNSVQAGLFTQGDSTAAAGVTQLGGMFSTNTSAGNSLIARKSFTGINAPNIVTLKSRGTNASPTVIVTGDALGSLQAYGYDGTNYTTAGSILNTSEGTIGTGIVPSRWTINTANSSGVNTEALRIDSSQNVLVTAPSGLGYGTGSGGTVTQATSKTTAVTLNKPSGQITMNNAALAANTTVSFQLNNSTIGTYDIVVIAQNGNVIDSSQYQVWSRVNTAGSVIIHLRNITAGSLSDAVILNFSIIKGSIN